jgi:SnoaL-like domain
VEVLADVNDPGSDEVKALLRAVTRLEAERDCATVLARYGFYCDHARRDEWVKLFTEDGVVDVVMYFGEDLTKPDPANWRRTRFVGHERLRELINSPANVSIVGRSQHQMGGPAAAFRLVDDSTAVMVTYSVVYVKDMADPTPHVGYQNHAMNRWTFRKVDGQWYIAENIRRGMGTPDTGTLFEDF